MDEQYRAAMINVAMIKAQIEAMGMMAENHKRQHQGYLPTYIERDFQLVITEMLNMIEGYKL